MDTNLAEKVLKENNDFKGAKHLVEVEGLSTPRVCNFLNKLVAEMDVRENYLEIGTYKGLTTFSAARGNAGKKVFACDRFTFYGKYTGWGFKVKKSFMNSLRRYGGKENAQVQFHHMTTQRLFSKNQIPGPVGVYFYDANHSHEETRDAIIAARPILADKFILIIDDWNLEPVRTGTAEGIEKAGYKTLWHRHLEGNVSPEGWWNGLAVFYMQKN